MKNKFQNTDYGRMKFRTNQNFKENNSGKNFEKFLEQKLKPLQENNKISKVQLFKTVTQKLDYKQRDEQINQVAQQCIDDLSQFKFPISQHQLQKVINKRFHLEISKAHEQDFYNENSHVRYQKRKDHRQYKQCKQNKNKSLETQLKSWKQIKSKMNTLQKTSFKITALSQRSSKQIEDIPMKSNSINILCPKPKIPKVNMKLGLKQHSKEEVKQKNQKFNQESRNLIKSILSECHEQKQDKNFIQGLNQISNDVKENENNNEITKNFEDQTEEYRNILIDKSKMLNADQNQQQKQFVNDYNNNRVKQDYLDKIYKIEKQVKQNIKCLLKDRKKVANSEIIECEKLHQEIDKIYNQELKNIIIKEITNKQKNEQQISSIKIIY